MTQTRPRRRCSWLAWPLLAIASHAHLQAHAGEPVTRYLCTMLDGTERVVAQDLSRMFGHAAPRCVAFQVAEALPPPAPAPVSARDALEALPGWSETASRLRASVRAKASSMTGGPGVSRLTVPAAYSELVLDASRRHGLDPDMVAALIHVESGYRATARSPKGALGLMQIMPATGARYGVHSIAELLIPAVNIDVGTRYLRDLTRLFDGDLELVLAAYNAGEGAVARYGRRIPPYRETRDYVRRILSLYGTRYAQR
ncbi:lytic transglycosylase domain-containing protein [Aquabacterium sp. A7-Y]|uniref:lytic transglycosylase domain-containing protein n=1 Tax=Aquabacterium sp. A7-Y TaxID=1349605 RepID=UPI00223DECFF|nr:lytic transglycosylase domain-containing protein [Aquabacterium sp. A7-Y]MCW7540273.1 lytic transglycosylase domain-containing protein [Aquabacterium sp. A7-Y]